MNRQPILISIIQALKYEEDYNGALESFSRSEALDPVWTEPADQRKLLIKALNDVKTLIELKGISREKQSTTN